MPENLHCQVRGCKKVIHAKDFEDGMTQLRHHYQSKHPAKFKQWGKKAAETRKNRVTK